MSEKFWRVVCKYGHVGRRNEVSVSRFLVTPGDHNLIDVLDIVRTMPGIKKSDMLSGVAQAEPITEEEYKRGKVLEENNFYLMKLKSYNPVQEHESIA